MDLPVVAGEELEEATGVCAPALFPDRIDLGWSFFRIASLVSIVSAGSPDDEAATPGLSKDELAQGEALKKRFETGLDAASALVARESFRLLPGFPPDVLRRSPSLSEVVVMVRPALMVMDRLWVSVCPPLVTWAVKFEVPAVVGVPLMTPVEALRDRPAGSAPAVMDQV